MKKILLLPFLFFALFPTTIVHAEEHIPLGRGMASVKLDHLEFTDGDVKKFGPEYGPYIGLEAYHWIAPHLFFGGEIGYFKYDSCGCVYIHDAGADPTVCDVDKEITYIPIELNVKYAIGTAIREVSLSLGGGVSFNHVNFNVSYPGWAIDEDDWLLGAQVSFDVNYEIGRFVFGINGKYQITEKMELRKFDADMNLNNWRAGGHIGIKF